MSEGVTCAQMLGGCPRVRQSAAQAERAAIVAWLRDQQMIGFARMERAETPTSQRNFAAGAEAVKRCADLIEAGQHSATQTKEPTHD